MQNLVKILSLLSCHERKRLVLLTALITIMALLDMIGVASILPFMTVLVNPSIIETNMYLNNIFQFSKKFGIETDQEFLFFLGIFVFILLFISLAFKSLTIYFQIRFVQMREYSIGKRLVEGYLHQPYSWFLNRNSSDLGKNYFIRSSAIYFKWYQPNIRINFQRNCCNCNYNFIDYS